ncbi:hypothetical protein HF086_004405 [Spodoptera exigua]|uniref:Uncharacterized protein n=1 Tax=Spodoptera exigua TaxID=7107 RepID=A0A922MEA2_SPOEX|nr:hypothetical protein HF086_004405 [Spodoptera exigua]
MNYIVGHNNLRLFSRNEGKIKSYESCRDLRAWSHDVQKRNRYLREWIKCDMPTCLLPISTLAEFLKTMTYRCRGRATPRCHPDCKSKAVLDSICNSCHAIKECLKNEEEFDKFFDDEEFETSHWPCERCLEALKSIKMFWKIIIEKIFNITLPKNDEKVPQEHCFTDSVQSVAKAWQTEMLQQAMYVKNYSPCILPLPCWDRKRVKPEVAPCNLRPCGYNDLHTRSCVRILSKPDCRGYKCCKNKSTDTDCLSNPIVSSSKKSCSSRYSQNQSRYCSAKIRTANKGCQCKEENEELDAYKANLDFLQEKCNCQRKEIERLKRENSSLKVELQNVYKSSSWKSSFHACSKCSSNHKTIALLPKPFECYAEENANTNQVKPIDSEMIITMKNCKNEAYRHISLLQVLHKTNDPGIKDLNSDGACGKRKEDPIELLTKVQNTFGAIVKREMDTIANNKRQSGMRSDIDATFHSLNSSRSAPSCSTITVDSTDSNHVRFFS